MEDILEEPETIQENSLFLTIWTRSTETFNYIFKHCPTKYVNGIITGYGIANAIILNLLFFISHISLSISLMVILAPLIWLLTWLGVYLQSVLMSWSGKWIGGRADLDQFVTVSAWSFVPAIASIFPIAIQAIVFDNTYSYFQTNEQNVYLIVLYYLILAARTGLTLWSFVIFIKGTAVLQQFSFRKSILNVILALSIIIVPIIIIGGLIYLL